MLNICKIYYIAINIMLIRMDELAQTQEEIAELERLCLEARRRYRNILKQRNAQTWWDWLWEFVGY